MSSEAKTAAQLATEKRSTIRKTVTETRRELRAIEAFARAWPVDIKVNQFHPHNLYGSVASVKIGDDFTSYGREDPRPSMADVVKLLKQLPPLPMVKHSGGGTSFRLASFTDARGGESIPVFPVILEIDPGATYSESHVVTWFAALDGLGAVEINCHLRPDSRPARVDVQARRDRSTGRVVEVRDTQLAVNPNFQGNFWIDQKVRYAAGSIEAANHFVLYWIEQDEEDAARTWAETICGIDYTA